MKKFNLYIAGKNTVREIQINFSHIYPGLSINFFSNLKKGVPDNSCVMFSPDVMILDLNPACQDGFVEVDENMTTQELENLIQRHFGLHAEVSPKWANQATSDHLVRKWHSDQKDMEDSWPGEKGRFPDFRKISFRANSIF